MIAGTRKPSIESQSSLRNEQRTERREAEGRQESSHHPTEIWVLHQGSKHDGYSGENAGDGSREENNSLRSSQTSLF